MPKDLNTAAIAAIAVGSIIIILHIISCLLDNRLCRILSYLNIVLHVGFFVLAFFGGFDFELTVCCFMGSVLIYSLLSYISYKRGTVQEEVNEHDL